MKDGLFQTLVLDQLREIRQDIRDIRADIRASDNKMDEGFAEVRREREIDRKKLEEVYQARNSVKIKFGWEWSLASFVLAMCAAGITQVFD
jgi:hypothetical protein